jgi:hypothetical protein
MSISKPRAAGNLREAFRDAIPRPWCRVPGAAFHARHVLFSRPMSTFEKVDNVVNIGNEVLVCAKVGNLNSQHPCLASRSGGATGAAITSSCSFP